ncbi:MAG: peptidoglycan DD-metalloendopeptidase family protein [Deltaproteobacteria bacterium]
MTGISALSALASEDGKLREANGARLKKAAEEFESLFINEMLKTMRKTIVKSEIMHTDDNTEELYTSMLDCELASHMAKAGGIGLSEVLTRQFGLFEDSVSKRHTPASAPHRVDNKAASPVERPDAANPRSGSEGLAGIAGVFERFKKPVIGAISSLFGMRHDPFTGERELHKGIDIAVPHGTEIYPAADGVVIFSGYKKGYGNTVEVRHGNGVVTRYAHCHKNLVKQGDAIKTSDPIGQSGSSGRSTGPHLHFEVIKDGLYVDPIKFFAG